MSIGSMHFSNSMARYHGLSNYIDVLRLAIASLVLAMVLLIMRWNSMMLGTGCAAPIALMSEAVEGMLTQVADDHNPSGLIGMGQSSP